MRRTRARRLASSHLNFNRNAIAVISNRTNCTRVCTRYFFFPRQRRITADNLMTATINVRLRNTTNSFIIGSYASTFFVDTTVRYFVLWYILKKIGSKQLCGEMTNYTASVIAGVRGYAMLRRISFRVQSLRLISANFFPLNIDISRGIDSSWAVGRSKIMDFPRDNSSKLSRKLLLQFHQNCWRSPWSACTRISAWENLI